MFLAIDIGNTKVKAGLFNGDNLIDFFITPGITNLIDSPLKAKINSAAFTSVSPSKTAELLDYFKKDFSLVPYQITHKSKFNLKIDYSTPETLGIDRMCSAEGAYSLFNKDKIPLEKNTFIVSVDFGTATTINIVSSKGAFIGGLILPGIQMMFESLNKNTAQLPLVTDADYLDLIGSSTTSSIASGVINSAAGLLEKIDKYLRESKGADSVLFYVTGGNAENINKYLSVKFRYVKELVLVGVNEIYKNNSGLN